MDLLTWALIAFIIAIISGALGFTGAQNETAIAVRISFGVFLVIALILLVLALLETGLVF